MDEIRISEDYLITFPDWELFVVLSLAILIDFFTGVGKARFFNLVRTSTALKRTIQKLTQYFSTLIVVWIVSNIVQSDNEHAGWFVQYLWYFQNGVIVFMIYIELTSILENAIAIDKESKMAKLITIPLHRILTIQTEKNPFYMYTKDEQLAVEMDKLNLKKKHVSSKNYEKQKKQDTNFSDGRGSSDSSLPDGGGDCGGSGSDCH